MWKVTLRGLLARKVRLVLTALAVVLGVAFVAGVYTLTDSLRAAFAQVFDQSAAGADLVVRSSSPVGDATVQRERMTTGVLEGVRQVDGVEAADGSVIGTAKLQNADGSVIQEGLAPTLGFSWPTVQGVGPLRLIDDGISRAPTGPGEIALDAGTAQRNHFEVGDEIRAQLQRKPSEPYRIVGLFSYGDSTDLGAVTAAGFSLETAQRGFDAGGLFDVVYVKADPSVPVPELEARIQNTLGAGYEVSTGQQYADDLAKPVLRGIGLLEALLLGFAAVGVFVGGFIIFNTFAILVSQRTRELGLVRALGASPTQVVASVLSEAAVVGALASAMGIVFGFALGKMLLGGVERFGFDVPDGPFVLAPRTVVMCVLVGVGVTMLSALYPAIRAARVSPIAAITIESRAVGVRNLRMRGILGVLVAVIGFAALAVALGADITQVEERIAVVMLGCFAVFVGIAMLAPVVARPLARVVGAAGVGIGVSILGAVMVSAAAVLGFGAAADHRWGAVVAAVLVVAAGVALLGAASSLRGAMGRLARGNAMRNPRRTGATASALALGLTLVCLVAIVAASVRESLQSGIEEGLKAPLVMSSPRFAGFSPSAATEARNAKGGDNVVALRFGGVGIDGRTKQLGGVDVDGFEQAVDLDIAEGDIGALAQGQLLISTYEADRLGVGIGDPVQIVSGRVTTELPVGAIYRNRAFTGSVIVDELASTQVYGLFFGEDQQLTLAFVVPQPNREADAVASIRKALQLDYPDVRVQTKAEFQAEQDTTIDLIVNVLLALLFLSLVIAVLGIVNTLLLSVFERTRELGLLRTVGMTPVQVRRMVRGEALIVAGIGCTLGIGVGVVWGWAFTRALTDQGVGVLDIPVPRLLVFVALSAAAGVFASLAPAWRAGNLNVLEAIAEE